MSLKSPLKAYKALLDGAWQTPPEDRMAAQKQAVKMALIGPSYNEVMRSEKEVE